ncbi:MAG: hypothetical protein FWE44_03195 [Defluviitaleaceae bacterium]|nr:hypothetical protein [Defluviitaleaceae bacterium]
MTVTQLRTVAVDGGNGTITNWGEQWTQYTFTFGVTHLGTYTPEAGSVLTSVNQSRYWAPPTQMINQGISNWFTGHRP